MEILKYTIPAFIVFLTTLLTFQYLIKQERQRRMFDYRMASREVVMPLRLQAYERIILLLERISPEAMLMRIPAGKKTAREYQSEMLKTIRAEFDHNLSQQLYLSTQSWELVNKARTNITQFINITTAKVGEMASAAKLSQKMLGEIMENQKVPTREAIDYLKKEARKEFL